VVTQHQRLTVAQERLLDAADFADRPCPQGGSTPSRVGDEDRPADGAQVPGLDRVLEIVPAAWHPVSIRGFLHTPQPDIAIAGAPATPLEWLKHTGGDIAPIVRLIEIAEWTGR
jgi:hypothetical protein